jgi:hypothetical protein
MGWKRGQSGNPGGRPYGSEKAYTEALRIVSKEEIDDPNRPGERISKLRRMADVAFEKALAGENWAIQHIAERFEGKPAQMLEHAKPGGQPVRRLVREFVQVVETREEFETKERELADGPLKLINGNGHDTA